MVKHADTSLTDQYVQLKTHSRQRIFSGLFLCLLKIKKIKLCLKITTVSVALQHGEPQAYQNFFSKILKIKKVHQLGYKVGQSPRSAPTTMTRLVFLSAVSSALARSRQASLEIKSNQRGGEIHFSKFAS